MLSAQTEAQYLLSRVLPGQARLPCCMNVLSRHLPENGEWPI